MRVWEQTLVLLPCSLVSSWHKHATPRLKPPSNSLTMAQTAWQGSKALPLNHIKVSLALQLKEHLALKKKKKFFLLQKQHEQLRGKKTFLQAAWLFGQ